ncbi:hypothetical protein ABT297_24685 [Dactylosporangium sp. NPDC000555]|uniref:hypothetical protein n=1 Tax=Dactylosporangium sp. NPDC000555 TaxID=3154260 RepID=UPI0033209ED3
MSGDLARRYRRLLSVYPPGPRREELLDTLLESAPPGRRWPTVRASISLLRHGARARLGRPGSVAVVVFAVLVALAGAGLGAIAGARLGWEAARPLPSGAEAEQLKATVFPDMTVWGGGDAALFVRTDDNEGIQYGYAVYWVKHTPATREVRAFSEAVRDRLQASGWQIRSDVVPVLNPGDEGDDKQHKEQFTRTFWATRDGLALRFTNVYWSNVYWPRPATESDGAATFELSRTEPPWILPAGVLGALLGALIGWALTAWVSRRTERSWPATLFAAATTGFALLLLLPVLLLLCLGLILGGDKTPQGQPEQPVWAVLFTLFGGLTKTVGILGLAVLIVAAWPRRRRPPADQRREPARLAARGMWVVPVVVLTAVVLLWAAVSAAPELAVILGLPCLAAIGLAVWQRHRSRKARPQRDPAPVPSWRAQAVPIIALVALLAVIWADGWNRAADLIRTVNTTVAATSRCAPTGPPDEPDPHTTRLSRTARVFVSPQATPDQVQLVQEAIDRITATHSSTPNRDPHSREFQTAYCGDARLPDAIGRTLPWYLTVYMRSPGAFGALVDEVANVPGVVAVRHAPPGDW